MLALCFCFKQYTIIFLFCCCCWNTDTVCFANYQFHYLKQNKIIKEYKTF